MSIRFSPVVQDGLDRGAPIVALETDLITHAFPRPTNAHIALRIEDTLRSLGVVPATIGFLDGETVVGMTQEEIQRLADEEHTHRLSIRDIPVVSLKGLSGGATLAATIHIAHRVGIKVVATTGLGGVHEVSGGCQFLQESSDLTALSNHPITLVASGVRPMLDLSATLERLETLSVPVLGYGTSKFPGFYVAKTEYDVQWQVNTPEEVAEITKARDDLALTQAVLIANPIADEVQVSDYEIRLAEAAEIAAQYENANPDDTQVILVSLDEASQGESWQATEEMYLRNAILAGEIVKHLSTTPLYTD